MRRYALLEAVDADEATTDLAAVDARRAQRERDEAEAAALARRAYHAERRRKQRQRISGVCHAAARIEAALVELEVAAERCAAVARYTQAVAVEQAWWARRAAT